MPTPTKSGLPKTKAWFTTLTLTDYEPNVGQWLTFWFPRRMVAWPLTLEGRDGYGPNNSQAESPDWWAYFQERHKVPGYNNYWVRGHLLNDNIHGPGSKENLVPISGTLNGNMHAAVEATAKKLVAAGKILRYVVEAHWEGCTEETYRRFMEGVNQEHQAHQAYVAAKAGGQAVTEPPHQTLAQFHVANHRAQQGQQASAAATAQWLANKYPKRKTAKVEWPAVTWTREMLHPWAMRQAYGNLLVPGEQFAPTRLSWSLEECTSWKPGMSTDASQHTFVSLAGSLRDPQWANNYPS